MKITTEDLYTRGFNQAFLLAKYNSPLIQKILETKNEGLYFEALSDGMKAFEIERMILGTNELNKNRSSLDRDIDLNR